MGVYAIAAGAAARASARSTVSSSVAVRPAVQAASYSAGPSTLRTAAIRVFHVASMSGERGSSRRLPDRRRRRVDAHGILELAALLQQVGVVLEALDRLAIHRE